MLNKYIKYVYCTKDINEQLITIAIIEKFTPSDVIAELANEYNIVSYQEPEEYDN